MVQKYIHPHHPLNAKCVEDIANQKIVAPLVETLLMVSQGQGLGVSWFSRNATLIELELVPLVF